MEADGGKRNTMRANGQRLCLCRGPTVFSGVNLSWRDKAVILNWGAETEVQNVMWVRFIVLRFGWPPLTYLEAFTPTPIEEEGQGDCKR